MNKISFKILAAVISVVMLFTAIPFGATAAQSATQLQQNISKLEEKSKELEKKIKELQGEINSQAAVKSALQQKINVIQQQINACNSEINKINSDIAKNNKQIEADKLTYKKRLRAIHINSSNDGIKVLLGAENFAEFLYLAQYTASVSRRDKKLITRLEEKIAANEKLLSEQVEIKNTVAAKQQELLAESSRIQSVINEIDANQGDLENQNAKIEKEIKAYKTTLASLSQSSGSGGIYKGGEFIWPTTRYRISAVFQGNDPVHRGKHDGIDIIGSYRGEISGQPVYAIADGVVDIAKGGCGHNYPKARGSCGCNGNFGNYVRIDHGSTYLSIYGHLSGLAVSEGTQVKKGQVIGYVGSTGWSTGYHLHFGIAYGGAYRNPMNYYKKVG